MTDIKNTEVLVLGSGLAALTAAIRLKDLGYAVSVVTKKGAGKASNTSYALGMFNAMAEKVGSRAHIEKTLETGSYLNDRKLVEAMVEACGEAFDYIQSLGMPLQDTSRGYKIQTEENKPIPGAAITDFLADKAREMEIEFYTFCLPVELLMAKEACKGALVMNADGKPLIIQADSVVLATGGFAGALDRNDNPPSMVGEGLVLAYRAGAALRDLEFIQYYPLGYCEPGLPQYIVMDAMLTESKLVNDQGEDVVAKYLGADVSLADAVLDKRDVLSISLEKEWKHSAVWMDITGKLPGYEGLYSKRYDFNNYPFRIRPLAHFTTGGVVIDPGGKTSVPGLYAAGEVTGGLHGADRLGGNALTEALTFGYLAANSIAADAGSRKYSSTEDALPLRWEEMALRNPLLQAKGVEACRGERNKATRETMNRIKRLFSKGLNPLRNEQSLEAVITEITALKQDIHSTQATHKETFTLEAVAALLELTAGAALLRRESRGGHYREDYPVPDETLEQKNTCWKAGTLHIK